MDSEDVSKAGCAGADVRVRRCSDPARGVGLFATRAFEVGEVVLREAPLEAMLEFGERSDQHCTRCLRALHHAADSEACAHGCTARWCSPACVRSSEAWHAHLCPARSEQYREYIADAEEACNEYFVLAARLFATPPKSRCTPSDADDANGSDSPALSPTPSSVCAGLKGVAWWRTVDAPAAPASAAAHARGARALTARQCARLRAALPPHSSHGLTTAALALAAGAIRMNAIGCAVAADEPPTGAAQPPVRAAVGLGLFDVACRANHSCAPSARLCCEAGCAAAAAVLRATRLLACGDEVTIDYLSDFDGAHEEKRALLREQYLFECACDVCVPHPALMTGLSAEAGAADDRSRVVEGGSWEVG
jgi:hypothetical protein